MATDRRFPVKTRVLIAPLDWGLGHATRSVPIIRELLSQNAEVLLAAEGAAASLLQQEFPDLESISLPGYRVKYAKTAARLPFVMLLQTRRLLKTIRREHEWLNNIIDEYNIDLVISDNRFGLYSSKIPCVFITHQLVIKTGSSFTEKILRSFNYRYINRFSECWVPDEKGQENYAGSLSHPSVLPAVPVHYIGLLSRLRKEGDTPVVPRHLFVSLSGPEPQRTMFENILVDQLSHYNFTATIGRGLPNEERVLPSTNSLRFFNHLPALQLQQEMAKAEIVISRSGYSTVMDVARMDKRSILVPTPGQTEQKYLASYLMEKGFALAASQKGFDLEAQLAKADRFFKNNMGRGCTHDDTQPLRLNVTRLLGLVQKS